MPLGITFLNKNLEGNTKVPKYIINLLDNSNTNKLKQELGKIEDQSN